MKFWYRVMLLTMVVCLVVAGWGASKIVEAAPINFTIWDFEGEVITPSTDLTANGLATSGSALGTQSFPAGNGSTDSWSFTSWPTGGLNVNSYFEFQVDLTNYGHITISFDERRSNTGIRDFEVRYSTDGINFNAMPTTVTNVPDNDLWRSHSFEFVYDSAIDQAIRGQNPVYFRIYGYNAEAGTGTWRIDNVIFNATTDPTAVTLSQMSSQTPTSPSSALWLLVGVLGVSTAVFLFNRRRAL